MNYFCLLRRNKNHSPCNYLLKTFGFMKISLFLLFFYTLPVLAENTHSQIVQQKVSVAGTVVDADGVPLTGVTVRVKGTTQGTITNIDGAYSLDLSDGNATLIFSYIGFESQEIQVAGKQTIDITLNEDINIMDEVVVIGYGTMQKRQVTSAIASLSADDLPVGVGGTDIAASLQGKIAGLVMAGNDSPNSESTFQLRGMGSINASKSPLIVIDGMPGGDIRNISPEEIESIDVLKDASAGAIYGSRATSGVILITTKQAKTGRIQLSYTGEAMFRQAFGKPHMLNAAEYLATGGKGDFGGDTDWYDEALSDQPLSQRHTITLQGGSENARIYASVAYNDNHGVLKYDNRKDYSGRMNTDFKLFDGWLDISTHLTYRQAARDRRFDRGDMEGVLLTNPTQPMLDPNSATGWNVWTGGGEGASVNKIAEAALQTREGLDKWFRPDVSLRLNILPVEGLTYRQTAAYENRQWENHEYDPSTQREEILAGRKGTARLEFNKTELLNTDGYFSYIKEIGPHSINATAGYSYYERNSEEFWMRNHNFSVDGVGFWNMANGSYLSDPDAPVGIKDSNGGAYMFSEKDITERLMAYFARANYSWNDKYMATASIRREATSKLPANHRWGTFWAVSAGWRLSKESFMEEVSWLDDLKLRAAYGVTGDQGFDANYAARMFGTDQYWLMPNGKWAQAYGVTRNINPDLRWEENHEWNIGLDFSVLDDRLWGSVDWYDRTKKGMIYEIDVPQPPNTHDRMFKNIGSFENRGWEVQLGADIVRAKDWNYTTTLNLSHTKTTVGSLYGDQSYMNGESINNWVQWAHRLEEGVEVGSYFLYRYAGVQDGRFQIYNEKNEVIFADDGTEDDRVYQGHATPTVLAGWSHSLSYKNWALNFTFTSWIDFDVYNAIELEYGLKGAARDNMTYDAISKNDHITGRPAPTDYFLYDGTFLKLQNLTLAYTLPMQTYTKHVQNIKLYVTGNNLFRWTKYPGINPEVDINDWGWAGIERRNNLYPQTRMFTLGLQLNF